MFYKKDTITNLSVARSNGIGSEVLLEVNNKAYSEDIFKNYLHFEMNRVLRNGTAFLLMTFNISQLSNKEINSLLALIHRSTRETDIKGWYKQDEIVGIIFLDTDQTSYSFLKNKITAAVAHFQEIFDKINISYAIFPNDKFIQTRNTSIEPYSTMQDANVAAM